jgi:hypothetical protein
MPAPTPAQLGPLAGLAGTWEGTSGLDVSYHNVEGEIGETPYRERVTLSPFGPVDNGSQQLFGLDYRMAAWREGEEDPFHTEVGYWLWDAARGEIYRCIMVPRATVLLAGGRASADSKTFTLKAEVGSSTFGVLENPYLAENAATQQFEITITVGEDSWSYEETTSCRMARMGGEQMAHTDRNTLTRVAE